MKDKKDLIEIWGDVVEVRSLVLSIVLCTITTMGLYSFAPSGDKSAGLILGLSGSVLGFIISTIIIKPKRDITVEEMEIED